MNTVPAEDRQLFQDIAAAMAEYVEDDATGHDMQHHWRVFRLGMRIAAEEGADKDVVGAAALTHDLHRVLGDGEFVDPEESLPHIRRILDDVGFPEKKREAVLHCIAVHEEYGFEDDPSQAETLEAELIQDADNLDAIGAVGLARCFQFSGAHGNPLWRPERAYTGEPYDKADLSDSAVYHIHDKLLKLAEHMNTDTAQELAADRHAFMEQFLDRFKQEWRGQR